MRCLVLLLLLTTFCFTETPIEAVILQTRQALIDHGAQIDLRTSNEYDDKIATRAALRLNQVVSLPTVNNFSRKLSMFSSEFMRKFAKERLNYTQLEKGNKGM